MGKTCPRCGGEFPATSEYFHSRGKSGGLNSYCKPCAGLRAAEWHRAHRECNLERFAEYRAEHRDELRRWHREDRDKDKKRTGDQAYYRANRARILQQSKRYYQANKPAFIKRARQWAKANPIKTSLYARVKSYRRRAAAPDAEAKAYIKTLMGDPCGYCGSRENIVIDHIHPVSKGGATTIDNLTAACRTCNAAKSDKSLVMFLLERRRS